jgi:glycyl-tRNA synthetase beta chain
MDLLFELGTEEIPARFMEAAISQFKEQGKSLLGSSGFVFDSLESWGTPRRLVLYSWNLRFDSSKAVTLKKGPPQNKAFDPQGKPTLALLGFLKKENGKLTDIQVKEGYVYLIKQEERSATEILSIVLAGIVQNLSFPKTMRWGEGEYSFVRPVRWICALWGKEVIPVSIFGIESAPHTYGLRFFSDLVKIEKAEDYEQKLEENFVLVRPDRRKERLEKLSQQLAMEVGGSPLWPEGLLEELVYLLEYPTPFLGSFPEEYLTLPADVLITTMRHHQKQLPVVDAQGNLLNYFICFRNGPALGEELVIKGNEQALTGRLEDARLFFTKDREKKLMERVPELKGIIFYEKLGTLWEKTQRIGEISALFCDSLKIPEHEKQKVLRTALLAKADLTSSLVQEFPELQGIMGKEYALLDGEDTEVAQGIAEHYWPRFFGDQEPKSLCGTIVSMADRIDTLVCFFGINMEPSGSSDPLALRRQAQGLISILLKKSLPLDLKIIISLGAQVSSKVTPWDEEKEMRLLEFLKQRLRFALEEEGFSFEEISCVLNGKSLVPYEVVKRAWLLKHLKEEDLKNLAFSFKRMKNILKSAGNFQPYLEEHEMEEIERELFLKLEEVANRDNSKPEFLLNNILEIIPYVGMFFDQVMVLTEEEKTRRKRLTLLLQTLEFMGRFGDFSALPF